MKSLVELQRLAVRRLLGVDMNDGFIEKLVVLFRPLPTSEIKLLNWTRKEKCVKLKRLERFVIISREYYRAVVGTSATVMEQVIRYWSSGILILKNRLTDSCRNSGFER
jgi:hypothetical protein